MFPLVQAALNLGARKRPCLYLCVFGLGSSVCITHLLCLYSLRVSARSLMGTCFALLHVSGVCEPARGIERSFPVCTVKQCEMYPLGCACTEPRADCAAAQVFSGDGLCGVSLSRAAAGVRLFRLCSGEQQRDRAVLGLGTVALCACLCLFL